MAKAIKTNVLRHLDAAGITYDTCVYEVSEDHLDGQTIARVTGLDPHMVYKTLVLCDDRNGHLVCVVPVEDELDLKKVARVSGHKSVSMLPMKELLPLTGYIRGGCSPIGMKKPFPTFIQSGAQSLERISVSAGMRGCQVILAPSDLAGAVHAVYADLIRDRV